MQEDDLTEEQAAEAALKAEVLAAIEKALASGVSMARCIEVAGATVMGCANVRRVGGRAE